MVAKDYTALKAAINAALPDNTTRLIDAVDVRQTGFIDSVDTLGGRIPITPQMFAGSTVLGDTNGTTGNGNDDTAAIQAAADFCETLVGDPTEERLPEPILLFPRVTGRGYRTTATIRVRPNIHIEMDADILLDGVASLGITGLEIGEPIEKTSQINYNLRVRKMVLSDWTTELSIGIKLINAETCIIFVDVVGFTIGMQCMGSGNGWAHNVCTNGRFIDNKFHLDLTNETGVLNGFCNQNTFFAGRFANSSTIKPNQSRYGVRIRSSDRTNDDNNQNVFFNCTFEMGGPLLVDAGECIPFLMEGAENNYTTLCRSEGNTIAPSGSHPDFGLGRDNVFAKMPLLTPNENTSTRNDFGWTHDLGLILELGSSAASKINFDQNYYGRLKLVFDTGSLTKTGIEHNSTSTHFPNIQAIIAGGVLSPNQTNLPIAVAEIFTGDFANDLLLDADHTRQDGDLLFLTTDGTLPAGLPATRVFVVNSAAGQFQVASTAGGTPIIPFTNAGTGNHTYHGKERWVRFGQGSALGLCVTINTERAKRFLFVQEVEPNAEADPSNGGRLLVQPFDSEGVLLDDNPVPTTGTRYVRGVKPLTYTWRPSNFGGVYLEGSDLTSDKYFEVLDTVKKIHVGVTGGTSAIVLRRFQIYTCDDYETAAETSVVYEDGWPGKKLVDGIPTTGVHFVGETAWLYPPVSGQPSHFTCTVEGAPGTWVSSANMT